MFKKNEAKANIAQNVRRLMDLYGWSQSELGRVAQVKQVFISRLLDEVMIPNAVDLANVAEALGTTSDALMTSDGIAKEKKKVSKSA